jgi:hypothetical protein
LNVLLPATAPSTFVDYYRCPPAEAPLDRAADLSTTSGFFSFAGARCYGQIFGDTPSSSSVNGLPDVTCGTRFTADGAVLPFDLSAVATNLREERYAVGRDAILSRVTSASQTENLYYLLRPMLPVGVRKHLQQVRLRGWQRIPFPSWPVDTTVDRLLRAAMGVVLKSTGAEQLPFIWFWPDGAPSCTMLTHDVEGKAGLDYCQALIGIDEGFEMKAAFQLIPEGAENAWRHADAIRARGCEVNLHDLNHDGRLYRDRATFLSRARRINDYTRQFGCRGFRSGAMYREQGWYETFEFSYDMSVPNVAHLEPQRGGCCTVMPYFVGDILELPLTTAQDYSLFFILGDYSLTLWRQQIEAIRRQNGLISVITHPDYLVGARERAVYVRLLEHIAELRDARQTWVALPGEINDWWRQRRAMTVSKVGSSWRVVGAGSERARVAYATLDGDRVVYSLDCAR